MSSPATEQIAPLTRLDVLRRYVAYIFGANLAWEIVQLPLYTLWRTAPAGDIAFAAVHCTAGDVIIASMSLLIAVLAVGGQVWPAQNYGAVAVTAILLGIGYTAYSEWTNVYVRQSWAYSAWMPIVPGTGLGLSPLLQWLVLPTIGFTWVRRYGRISAPVIEHPRESKPHVRA